MTKNDYLSFNSLSDLERYARKHNIFDSGGMNKFHNDYILHLTDKYFNEHYYLNKRYDGKTPLELAEERANYLAGIDNLLKNKQITELQADNLIDEFAKVRNRENAEIENLIKEHHPKLFAFNQAHRMGGFEQMREKLVLAALNQEMLENSVNKTMQDSGFKVGKKVLGVNILDSVRSDSFLGVSILDDNKNNSFADKFYRAMKFELPHLSPKQKLELIKERKEQSKKEEIIAIQVKENYKNYSKSLLNRFKQVEKRTLHIIAPDKKNEVEEKLIKSWRIPIDDNEKQQLQEFKNQKINEIRILKRERSSKKWFSLERKEANAKLDKKITEFAKKEKDLHKEIKYQRISLFQKVKNNFHSVSNLYFTNDLNKRICETRRDKEITSQIDSPEPQQSLSFRETSHIDSPKPQQSLSFRGNYIGEKIIEQVNGGREIIGQVNGG
ncbi:MAG: hypothetical protein Ta2D_10740 [Rickettsiales bacterium]|nr:MAG: hypothetical protein Ta2D_10740 [Rickettsiales bacterium]